MADEVIRAIDRASRIDSHLLRDQPLREAAEQRTDADAPPGSSGGVSRLWSRCGFGDSWPPVTCSTTASACLYAFDCIWLEAQDLRGVELTAGAGCCTRR